MAALIILTVLCLSPVLVRPEMEKTCPQDNEKLCKDMKKALECGAFTKCVENNWSTSKEGIDLCALCKGVAREIGKVVGDKVVEDDVKAVLLKICSMIPSKPLADQCTSYVKAFLPLAIQFLKNELQNPDALCAALCVSMMRSNNTHELQPKQVINLPPKAEDAVLLVNRHLDMPQCELCLLVLKKLEEMLPMVKTKAAILHVLDQICSVLPEHYSESCLDFVKNYGEKIIDMILNQLGPNAICFSLHLCYTDQPALSEELGITSCDTCEKMVHHLSLGQKHGTDMMKTCSSMSGVSHLSCEDFVYVYKPQLDMMLHKSENSNDICKELDLCVRMMKARLLGENECTWGPRHWCADKAVAARCKATKYCEEHGWL
ncbi:prosaposin-like isoform X1 [Rhinoraja longicauda]